MSEQTFYPTIPAATLAQFQAVVQSISADPDYLNSRNCTFSEDTKDFFRKLTGVVVTNEPDKTIFDDGVDRLDTIEDQIGALIKSLDDLAASISDKESSEQIAILKTKAGLVEKLIGMKERVFNLKQISEFQAVVMRTLEDICTKDQVAEFIKRLS